MEGYFEYFNVPIQEHYDNEWEQIDHVLYINLAKATERNIMIQHELAPIPSHKITRLEAILDTPGSIGCTKSHIAALQLAIDNNWKNVLIVEDDIMWHKYESGIQTLRALIQEHPYFDVITLGNAFSEFDPDTFRLIRGNSTSGYLVNQHYFKTLQDNYKEGLQQLMTIQGMPANEKTNRDQVEMNYAIDQYWMMLQKRDIWYIVHPALAIQRPSYSDIEEKMQDYRSYYNGVEL